MAHVIDVFLAWVVLFELFVLLAFGGGDPRKTQGGRDHQ